jgi:hypothetical protein
MIITNTVKKLLLLVLLNALVLIPIFTQDSVRDDFWVCPVFESNWYSVSKVSIGGGAALGYGDKVAFGLKAVYFDDMNEFRTIELNFLLRFYLFRGLFIQLNGGPVIFARSDNLAMPSKTGTLSGGLSMGWRFHLGRHFFLEPSVRGGYPYLAGAGLSAGVRF